MRVRTSLGVRWHVETCQYVVAWLEGKAYTGAVMKTPMSPRERVLAILERKPVDRIPVDFWRTEEVHRELCKYTGATDERGTYVALGVDKIFWFGVAYRGPLRATLPSGVVYDLWGCGSHSVQAGLAEYQERAEYPLLACETIDDLRKYPFWPEPSQFDYEGMVSEARSWARDFVVMGPWVSFFEIYCAMRGLEQALIDLMERPEYVQAALDRIEAIQTSMLEVFLPQVRDIVSCVFVSDDMGSQHGPLVSLHTWREFFELRMKRWCDLIHRHGMKVCFHTDGAVRPLIPYLMETGIDVLNPIQHVCPGMGLEGLKRDFGDHLIFHGAVDNQTVLPRGTPEDVRREVRYCLETLGSDGEGYICASCHRIQAGTPIENIVAMIEAVRESSALRATRP